MVKTVKATKKNKEEYTTLVLGTDIGTNTGWDQNDTFVILYFDVVLNEKGRAFIPDLLNEPNDILIDFYTGKVATYDSAGLEVTHNVDWAVFS